MGSLDKLKRQLLSNPRAVRFDDVVRVLGDLGYQQVRRRGSHCVFRKADGTGASVLVVEPHGTRAYCARADVEKVVALLEEQNAEEERDDD